MPETLTPELHPQTQSPSAQESPSSEPPVLAETLVEEVSIDGMCGVY